MRGENELNGDAKKTDLRFNSDANSTNSNPLNPNNRPNYLNSTTAQPNQQMINTPADINQPHSNHRSNNNFRATWDCHRPDLWAMGGKRPALPCDGQATCGTSVVPLRAAAFRP